MTLSLIAQAAIHQLRLRLGEPAAKWDAEHFASNLFQGLEGDIRVSRDTVLAIYYNAPNAELLRAHYEDPPRNYASKASIRASPGSTISTSTSASSKSWTGPARCLIN